MSAIGESTTSQLSEGENIICRDFLRKVCKRGRRCKFFHPTQTECEKIRRSERTFCHDFQNSVCRRIGCKFLHYSREDEEFFRTYGYLPDEAEPVKEGSLVASVEDQPPICKDFLNGICTRGSACKYRHVPSNFDKTVKTSGSMENIATVHTDRRKDDAPEYDTKSFSPMMSFNQSKEQTYNTPVTSSRSVPLTMPSMQQPAFIDTGVVAQAESVLTPVKDIYLSNGPVATPVVGLIDHVGLPPSNIQHTVYAHSSNLGTFTPFVSVSSASQNAPCSSVLAVVAEPSQHPTVIQHPVTSQTTYHIVPNNASNLQPHIFAGSSTSSTAAVFTIPVPHYPCSNTGGAILGVESTSAQHSAVLTTVLPTNRTLTSTPAPGYSSYNLVQIAPSSAVETVPVFNSPCGVPTDTSTASSSAAVFAAAAAPHGYLTQQVPLITSGPRAYPAASHLIANNSNAVQSVVHYVSQAGTVGSESRGLTVITSNVPTVSVATAAKAYASSAKTEESIRHTESSQAKVNESRRPYSPESDINETTAVLHNTCDSSPNLSSLSGHSAVSPTSPPHSHRTTSHDRFTQRADQEEHAKTAAAVAAAACIGAMFSQPLSDRRHGPTSVAAMLDDLMHRHQSFDAPMSDLEQEGRGFAKPSSNDHFSNLAQDKIPVSQSRSVESDRSDKDTSSNLSTSSTVDSSKVSEQTSSSSGTNEHASIPATFHGHSKSAWSSVATTVASAAQAAAAAAVAATAAVTHSAKFFQLNRKQKMSQSATQCVNSGAKTSIQDASPTDFDHSKFGQPNASEADRSTLSPETAVTMTSAAAAAAMAAAAASAAAKERLFSKTKKSTREQQYSEYCFTDQAKQPLPSKRCYGPELSRLCADEGYATVKHCNLSHKTFSRSHAKSFSLRDAIEADTDDDDIDESVSGFASPDITPPYSTPSDTSNIGSCAGFSDTRTEFCETDRWDFLGKRPRIVEPCGTAESSTDKYALHHSFGAITPSTKSSHKLSVNSQRSFVRPMRRSHSTESSQAPFCESRLYKCKSDPALQYLASTLSKVEINDTERSRVVNAPVQSQWSCNNRDYPSRKRRRNSLSLTSSGLTKRRLHWVRRKLLATRDTRIPVNYAQRQDCTRDSFLGGYRETEALEYIDADREDATYDLRYRQQGEFDNRTASSLRNPQTDSSQYIHTSTILRQQQALRAENARLRRKLVALIQQSGDLRVANEILLEQNARLRHSNKRTTSGRAARGIDSNQTQSVQCVSKAASHTSESQGVCVAPSRSLSTAHHTLQSAARDSKTDAVRGVYVSSPTASNSQQALQAVSPHSIFPSALVASAVPGTITLSSHQSLAAVQIQAPTDQLAHTVVSSQPSLTTNPQNEQQAIGYFQHQLQPPVVSISSQNMTAPSSTIQVCHYPVQSSGTGFPANQSAVVTPSMLPVAAPSSLTLLVRQPAAAYTAIQPHLTPSLQMQTNMKAEQSTVNLAPIPFVYQNSPSTIFAPGVPCSLTNDSNKSSSNCRRSLVVQDNPFSTS